MSIARTIWSMAIAVGLLLSVAGMFAYQHAYVPQSANAALCRNVNQLASVSLQAMQIGNPTLSVRTNITQNVRVTIGPNLPAATVTMAEKTTGASAGTLSITGKQGPASCLDVAVPVRAFSLPDNVTVARPTPTP